MSVMIPEVAVNIDDKPHVIGEDQQALFEEMLAFVLATSHPINCVGAPGTGKTHMLRELGKQFVRMQNIAIREKVGEEKFKRMDKVKFFWTQINLDTMPSTLIAGHRFENGTEIPVAAVLGKALTEGHFAVADEFTHGDESIQGPVNSMVDPEGMISIGDMTYFQHWRFRLALAHNRRKSAGNVGIIPSLASRLVTWEFDYPEALTESKIARDIVRRENRREGRSEKDWHVPNGVLRFLVSWMREVRDYTGGDLPLSSRNIAAAATLLNMLPFHANADMPPEWRDTSAAEAIRLMVANRVHFIDPNSPDPKKQSIQNDNDLGKPLVNDTLQFF